MNLHKFLLFSLCAPALAGVAHGTTIHFEQYPNATQITDQYASDGVTFANAEELVNPFFPTHSGMGVVTNAPNPTMTVSFAVPQSTVSGYYSSPFSFDMKAYNAAGQMLDTVGLGADVNAGAGASDLFTIGGTDISSIEFNVPVAGYMTLDDLSFQSSSAVPEPSSIFLLGSGLLAAAGALRRKFVS